MGETFSPTYQQQQFFTLSMLINRAVHHHFSQEQLQQSLSEFATSIGQWSIVWGPYYYQPSSAAGIVNALYVAKQDSTLVVSVSATREKSIYDWQEEDLNATPVAWQYASGAGNITAGDNLGLTNILGALTDNTGATAPQTIQQYLSSIADKSTLDLVITGHSLGGALAPLLAMALLDPASTLNQNPDQDVSINQWQSLYLMPTAGPSPGDQTFVAYFQQTVANAGDKWNNAFIWNSLDVIPHAWSAATLAQLSTLYSDISLPSQGCIALTIQYMQTNSAEGNYTQFEPQPAIIGTLQPYEGLFIGPQVKFLAQLMYQHVRAYIEAFNCTWILQQYTFNPCSEPFLMDLIFTAVCLFAREKLGIKGCDPLLQAAQQQA